MDKTHYGLTETQIYAFSGEDGQVIRKQIENRLESLQGTIKQMLMSSGALNYHQMDERRGELKAYVNILQIFNTAEIAKSDFLKKERSDK